MPASPAANAPVVSKSILLGIAQHRIEIEQRFKFKHSFEKKARCKPAGIFEFCVTAAFLPQETSGGNGVADPYYSALYAGVVRT